MDPQDWYNKPMEKSQLIDILGTFFKSKPVNKAYIFGSVARGEQRPDSDLDIVVELDRSKPIGLEFIQLQLELEELLNKKVDLLTEKSISKHISPFIEKDKVLIYEK